MLPTLFFSAVQWVLGLNIFLSSLKLFAIDEMFSGGTECPMAAKKSKEILQKKRNSRKCVVPFGSQRSFMGYTCCNGESNLEGNCSHKRQECGPGKWGLIRLSLVILFVQLLKLFVFTAGCIEMDIGAGCDPNSEEFQQREDEKKSGNNWLGIEWGWFKQD